MITLLKLYFNFNTKLNYLSDIKEEVLVAEEEANARNNYLGGNCQQEPFETSSRECVHIRCPRYEEEYYCHHSDDEQVRPFGVIK